MSTPPIRSSGVRHLYTQHALSHARHGEQVNGCPGGDGRGSSGAPWGRPDVVLNAVNYV